MYIYRRIQSRNHAMLRIIFLTIRNSLTRKFHRIIGPITTYIFSDDIFSRERKLSLQLVFNQQARVSETACGLRNLQRQLYLNTSNNGNRRKNDKDSEKKFLYIWDRLNLSLLNRAFKLNLLVKLD